MWSLPQQLQPILPRQTNQAQTDNVHHPPFTTKPFLAKELTAVNKETIAKSSSVLVVGGCIMSSAQKKCTVANTTSATITATNTNSSSTSSNKCHWKKCDIFQREEELVPCSVVGCHKKFHPSCRIKFINSSHVWLDKDKIRDATICSKGCYTKFVAAANRKPTWSNDGEKGHEDPNTSEKILLDWLRVKGNYANLWCGKGSKEGKTKKKQIAAELAQVMNAANVRVVRNGKQILNKIAHMEKLFRTAHDFAKSQTGQDLKMKNVDEFNTVVRGKCQYYFDLLAVFGDTASAVTSLPSSSLSSSSSSTNEILDSILDKEMYVNLGGHDVIVGMDGSSSSSSGRSSSHNSNNDDGDCDDGSDNDNTSSRGNLCSESQNQTEAEATSLQKKTSTDHSSYILAGKKKKAVSSPSMASAATKKKKSLSLLTHSTSSDNSLSYDGGKIQEKIAEEKLQLIQNEKVMSDLKVRIESYRMIRQFHEENPDISKEDAEILFPTALDIVNIIFKTKK